MMSRPFTASSNAPGAARSSTTAYSCDALCAGKCAIQSCAFAAVRAVPLIVYPASRKARAVYVPRKLDGVESREVDAEWGGSRTR
jgi:hypothetical protein